MNLQETLATLQTFHPEPIPVGIILGSGLGEFTQTLTPIATVPYSTIPHFATPTVAGHTGQFIIAKTPSGMSVACLQGRFHYYEGHPIQQVVYPVQVLKALGVEQLIVTNAAGGINPHFQAGDLMLITDHLNLMGINPLMGPNEDTIGPRFPAMSEAYSLRLRELASNVADQLKVDLKQGVYACFSGPSYETPAEVRMLKTLGADAVGMSTVPEVITAVHRGLNVLGLSCISNPAAGLSSQAPTHTEVIEAIHQMKPEFTRLVLGLLDALSDEYLQ